MVTEEKITRCWQCGTINQYASAVPASVEGVNLYCSGSMPIEASAPGASDGDYSFCDSCGAWGVFVAKTPNGLRQPTKHEHKQLMMDPTTKAVLELWTEQRQPRH